ncbi:hypothetical protein F5X99DRAFT_142969 [Biscogniauxia marginata]|nr:hypothetical protein F5X99DRAFT_142969 [Biscogniauxia marginata]
MKVGPLLSQSSKVLSYLIMLLSNRIGITGGLHLQAAFALHIAALAASRFTQYFILAEHPVHPSRFPPGHIEPLMQPFYFVSAGDRSSSLHILSESLVSILVGLRNRSGTAAVNIPASTEQYRHCHMYKTMCRMISHKSHPCCIGSPEEMRFAAYHELRSAHIQSPYEAHGARKSSRAILACPIPLMMFKQAYWNAA